MAELFHIRADNWVEFQQQRGIRFSTTGFQIDEAHAKALWDSFAGKQDKEKLMDCFRFARSIGIDDEDNFCGKIFLMVKNRFLFPVITEREQKEKLPDSKKSFQLFREFVEELIRLHEQNPMPEEFYQQKFGMEYNNFMIALKNAVEFARDNTELVVMLNSISPQLGEQIFSKWLVIQRGINEKVGLTKRIASLKKRFEIFLKYGE